MSCSGDLVSPNRLRQISRVTDNSWSVWCWLSKSATIPGAYEAIIGNTRSSSTRAWCAKSSLTKRMRAAVRPVSSLSVKSVCWIRSAVSYNKARRPLWIWLKGLKRSVCMVECLDANYGGGVRRKIELSLGGDGALNPPRRDNNSFFLFGQGYTYRATAANRRPIAGYCPLFSC